MNKYKRMVEQIRTVIQANLDEEIVVNAFAVRVSEILKKFDGKKVTRRMATALQKAMPEHTMFYNTDFDMPKITVNRIAGDKSYPKENKITFYLGGGKDSWKNPNFDHEAFVNHHAICYLGAAVERCEKRKELLQDSEWLMKTAKALVNYLEASEVVSKIKDSHDDFPDKWAILELVPFELKVRKKK
jgi:hypothetical protein